MEYRAYPSQSRMHESRIYTRSDRLTFLFHALSAYKNDAKNSLLRGWGFSEDRGSEFDADGQGGPDNMEFSPDRDRDEMYAEDGMKVSISHLPHSAD